LRIRHYLTMVLQCGTLAHSLGDPIAMTRNDCIRCLGLLLLCSALNAAPPPNDDFAQRTVLSGESVSVEGTTVDATEEPDQPGTFHAFSSVWYAWTAPHDGNVSMTVSTTNFEAVWYVYTNVELASLEAVQFGFGSGEQNFDVLGGIQYQIEVLWDQPVPWPRHQGPFTLRLRYNAPPPNDHFAQRIRLRGRAERLAFRNVLATLEPGEPAPPGPDGGHTVWYEWRAPESGLAAIRADPLSFFAMSVYQGDALGALTFVTNNRVDWGCVGGVLFPVNADERYQIALDTCFGSPGNYAGTLNLNGAALLANPLRRPDLVTEMTLFGDPERNYVLEGSTNLLHWLPLSTNAFYGPMVVADDQAGQFPHRFYRARLEE
jgi:hypothetical protein